MLHSHRQDASLWLHEVKPYASSGARCRHAASASLSLGACLGFCPPRKHGSCTADSCSDPTGPLKLVGFGSSPRTPSAEKIAQHEADANKAGNQPSEDYQRVTQQAHQRLACCLHYILSGIHPDQEAFAITTPQERTSFREKICRGGQERDSR
jgi:hypothetical protein